MIQDQVKSLSNSHRVLVDAKYARHLAKLERMRRFYFDKIPVAPPKQSGLFEEFVAALDYSISILRQYRKLTIALAKLALEGEDNNVT